MRSFLHLLRIASDGFDDMRPALHQAFNDNPLDDRLQHVFGTRPRTAIALITVAAIIVGLVLQSVVDSELGFDIVNVPAVCVSLAFALFIRRYLFGAADPAEGDFPWLAATIIPAAALLVLLSIVGDLVDGNFEVLPGAPWLALVGGAAKLLADASEVAAGVTIAVAALCYSQRWGRALWQLGWQLLILKLLLAIILFVMLEISLMERILSAIVEAVFGFRLPEWMGEFVDQITYAAILFSLYFAIIGATWTVCRRSFSTLLETGDVDIIETVRTLVDPDAEKKARKKTEKAEKKARKAEAKVEKKARKETR